jgi:D-alanyl-D-alanine carboxypeptidase
VRSVATHRGTGLLLVAVLTLTGCSAFETGADEAATRRPSQPPTTAAPTTPSPTVTTPTPTPSEESSSPEATPKARSEPQAANPVVQRIPDSQWDRIVAAGAWRPGCPVGRSELRRVRVNYVNFDGNVRRGTLVVNEDIAASTSRIFTRLFEERFPIRRMLPVEHYDGDVNVSLAADNTSAYNCRQLNQINAPVMESPHANGRAIDINPRENPWVDLRCDCWLPSPAHRERVRGKGKIVRNGLVVEVFEDEGWIWQNIDVPDYMHFDTGYPSRAYRGPEANKRWHERQERREDRQERRQQRR